MALFVLGAGATRGCSFVDRNSAPCIPPLDSDFFTQLQKVRNPKHSKLIDAVMKDVVQIFGPNFTATLETVFTTYEHTIRMLQVTGDNRAFKRTDLTEKRNRLLQAVAAVLEESLTVTRDTTGSSRNTQSCRRHRDLVENVLKPRDDVISFNYDTIIDAALKEHGSMKWNSRYGYGFELGPRGKYLEGDDFWQPETPAASQDTLHLFKLHGSLHFQVKGKNRDEIRLKQRPYTAQMGKLNFDIIPPEWNKEYDRGVFSNLWKRAANAIRQAKQIVLIGYSLPPIDLHSTALFRTAISGGTIRSLVVVNPDREARRRSRAILQRGLSDKTRILSVENMAEFVSLSADVWRR